MRIIPRISTDSYMSGERYGDRITVENRVYMPPVQTMARVSLPENPGLLARDDDAQFYWDASQWRELAGGSQSRQPRR